MSSEDNRVSDPEKAAVPSYTRDEVIGTGETEKLSWATRNGLNLESFKRRNAGGVAELNTSMKPRHLQMIAIGGSIGAGFFVGSGKALASGGPGSVFIDYLLIGLMIFNVVYALGELAIMYPVSGGFYTYATRFIDPAWGFAMGWNYTLQWMVVLPFELTVCAITIQYWNETISVGVWVTIFLVAIVVINIFGTLGYAEEEFWSSVLKLGAIVTFMIIAVVLVCGGGPDNGRYNEYWGGRYWQDPGAFRNGFYGFCSVFVTAAFSFSGAELVGLAAAESENPTKNLPSAIKQVFWRITLFYVVGLTLVGLLVPADDPNLLGGSGSNTSPFVLAAKYSGLKGYDHFLNSIILVSVISIGLSAVYGGSRTLTAMAEQGYAPKVFTYVDKSGRPLVSVTLIILFSFLAYVNLSKNGGEIFDWLLAISGLAALFTWGSICAAHIRFRRAWKLHGRSLEEIPFLSVFGETGSWFGLIFVILVLIAQFYVAVHDLDVAEFFKSYLAMPVVLCFLLGGWLWNGRKILKLKDIDLDSGRRQQNWDEINARRAEIQTWSKWRQIAYKFF